MDLKDEKFRFQAVSLNKGSWFGDYQILLNIPCTWDIEAGLQDNKKSSANLPPNMMQLYELPGEEFVDLCDKNPAIRKFIIVRSLVRRAYFKKAFDDNT